MEHRCCALRPVTSNDSLAQFGFEFEHFCTARPGIQITISFCRGNRQHVNLLSFLPIVPLPEPILKKRRALTLSRDKVSRQLANQIGTSLMQTRNKCFP